MRFTSLALGLASLTFAACGSTVDALTGGTTGGTGGDPSGGSGGSGGGSSDLCAHTADRFSFTLTPGGGGTNLDCSGNPPGDGQTITHHLEGVSLNLNDGGFMINTCPKGVTCDLSAVLTLTFASPGLSPSIPDGALVQIDVQTSSNFWTCTQSILVRNLPTWDGFQSPLGAYPVVLVAGVDGTPTFAGAPFGVTAAPLGCYPPDPATMGCVERDELRFDVAAKTGTIPVAQGETATFLLDVGSTTQSLRFRNLRSFQSGWCDDYWDYAWWATWMTPTGI